MDIARYIIWTTSLSDTSKAMDTLSPHSTVVVSISDTILCLETELTTSRIRSYLGDDLEMACIEIDDQFIKKLMKTKFKLEEKKNFSRFLNLTKIPETIDEALDLINERGGLEFLNSRERMALDKLYSKRKLTL